MRLFLLKLKSDCFICLFGITVFISLKSGKCSFQSRVMANRLLLSYLCICDREPVSEKNKIVLLCRAVCRNFEKGGGGWGGGGGRTWGI